MTTRPTEAEIQETLCAIVEAIAGATTTEQFYEAVKPFLTGFEDVDRRYVRRAQAAWTVGGGAAPSPVEDDLDPPRDP